MGFVVYTCLFLPWFLLYLIGGWVQQADAADGSSSCCCYASHGKTRSSANACPVEHQSLLVLPGL